MNRLVKKILFIGICIFTIMTVGADLHNVSARQHINVTRSTNIKRQRTPKNSRYYSFKQLINAMNYDYHHRNTKNIVKIQATVKHNLKAYSQIQLYKISHNPDYNDLYTDQNNYQLEQAVQNRYFGRAFSLKMLDRQDTQFDTKIRSYLVKDINRSRTRNGLKPLKVTAIAQMTADFRNPRVQFAYDYLKYYKYFPHNTSNPTDLWVHGYDTGDTGGQFLLTLPYYYTYWSANAENWSLDPMVYGDYKPLKYSTRTPKGIAANANSGFVNHDMSEGNYNSHRDTELSPKYKYLGVGVTYDKKKDLGTVNEQYIG